MDAYDRANSPSMFDLLQGSGAAAPPPSPPPSSSSGGNSDPGFTLGGIGNRIGGMFQGDALFADRSHDAEIDPETGMSGRLTRMANNRGMLGASLMLMAAGTATDPNARAQIMAGIPGALDTSNYMGNFARSRLEMAKARLAQMQMTMAQRQFEAFQKMFPGGGASTTPTTPLAAPPVTAGVPTIPAGTAPPPPPVSMTPPSATSAGPAMPEAGIDPNLSKVGSGVPSGMNALPGMNKGMSLDTAQAPVSFAQGSGSGVPDPVAGGAPALPPAFTLAGAAAGKPGALVLKPPVNPDVPAAGAKPVSMAPQDDKEVPPPKPPLPLIPTDPEEAKGYAMLGPEKGMELLKQRQENYYNQPRFGAVRLNPDTNEYYQTKWGRNDENLGTQVIGKATPNVSVIKDANGNDIKVSTEPGGQQTGYEPLTLPSTQMTLDERKKAGDQIAANTTALKSQHENLTVTPNDLQRLEYLKKAATDKNIFSGQGAEFRAGLANFIQTYAPNIADPSLLSTIRTSADLSSALNAATAKMTRESFQGRQTEREIALIKGVIGSVASNQPEVTADALQRLINGKKQIVQDYNNKVDEHNGTVQDFHTNPTIRKLNTVPKIPGDYSYDTQYGQPGTTPPSSLPAPAQDPLRGKIGFGPPAGPPPTAYPNATWFGGSARHPPGYYLKQGDIWHMVKQ